MAHFEESKHPRDKKGKFTDGKSKADKIKDAKAIYDEVTQEEYIPRSLSAKANTYDIKMPDGSIAHFVEGTRMHHKEVIAGAGSKTKIRDVDRLVNSYGGAVDGWVKIKAQGTIECADGEIDNAEIHWYEEPTKGKYEHKFKKWIP